MTSLPTPMQAFASPSEDSSTTPIRLNITRPIRVVPSFREVILQPTSLCNLRCEYCYLGDINKNLRMSEDVAAAVARAISLRNQPRPINVLWHGGEPLMVGRSRFEGLLDQFETLHSMDRVSFSLQTNATAITAEWCELFRKHDIHVGISIDGPEWANTRRRDLRNNDTWDRTLRGIRNLQRAELDFSIIAVVSMELVDLIVSRIDEYLAFFSELRPFTIGFNIEEEEAANQQPNWNGQQIRRFWQNLYDAWERRSKPRPRIREFDRVLRYVLLDSPATYEYDIFPTVGYNGDVVALSPELLGTCSNQYSNFVVGNVLVDDIDTVLERAVTTRYVQEFAQGTSQCLEQCPYYDYCGGGQAGNRFFEHGSFLLPVTKYCRAARQYPFDVVQSVLGEQIMSAHNEIIRRKAAELLEIDDARIRESQDSRPKARFDNRPTWDNWPKSPGPFDNRPTWDNWDK